MLEPDLFIHTGNHDRDSVEALNKLFLDAAQKKASDIHFLTSYGKCEVSFRFDGKLELITTFDQQMTKLVDEKIRSRANLSTADRHIPLDGRMRLVFPETSLDIRVGIVPNVSGQYCVCRLLDQANAARPLDEIEMTAMLRHCLEELVEEPNGLLLVSGPTGSGKTTLLYALLGVLHNGERSISTIENPVEYLVAGLNQINVSQHISFANALRSVLRLDPDVILVGEIRDAETAQIAVQAANTGHLVLATVHANDSAMAVTRLIDFGIEPQTLAAALRGVIAQRLVKRVAPECTPQFKPANESQLAWMNLHGIVSSGTQFPVAKSVHYDGRVPIIEMIKAEPSLRKAIIANRGPLSIFNAAARQPQFETLAMAGIRLAAEGLTTIEQVQRTVGQDAIVPEGARLGQVLVNFGKADSAAVNAAVERQMQLRKAGRILPLGEILIKDEVCTVHDVIEALGYTEGAIEAAQYFVVQGKVGQPELKSTITDWKTNRQGESLFDLLVAKGLLKEEDLNEPSIIYCAGKCNGCTPGYCKRLNSDAAAVQGDAEVV